MINSYSGRERLAAVTESTSRRFSTVNVNLCVCFLSNSYGSFFEHKGGTRVCMSLSVHLRVTPIAIHSGGFVARAFLLIAAFGQSDGNGSQCSEETILSLIGPGGEK
jgi:hypothetical protein